MGLFFKIMIKVLRIINRFNIGGPTYNATFLTRFLDQEFETRLIGGLPEVGEADSLHIVKEYDVEPIILEEMQRNPNIFSDLKAFWKLRKVIKEFRPDIVHTHASKAGALGRLAAFSAGVPVIVHTYHGHVFHSYFGSLKTKIFKAIERFLARRSTGIIAISALQKEEIGNIHRICSPEKIEIIPLGFDLTKFQYRLAEKRVETRSKYGLEEDEVAVAIVGRLAPIKNHAMFLDACELALNQGILKTRFFIVGDGELFAEIKTRVDELNARFDGCIVMTSWIKDIATFNAGMDLICLTSNNEGTPVSLIEAQACGVPVLTSDVGGVEDILDEGETGIIVPAGNTELFAEKLVHLINEEEIRKKMSQNGWNFVCNKFHYKRLVHDMERYYRQLIQNNKRK